MSTSHWVLLESEYIKKNGLSSDLSDDLKVILSHKKLKYVRRLHSPSITTLFSFFAGDDSFTMVKPYFFGSGNIGIMMATDLENKTNKEILKWNAVLEHFAKAKAGKPSAKWLRDCKGLVDDIGIAPFKLQAIGWLKGIMQKAAEYEKEDPRHRASYYQFIDYNLQQMVKGLAPDRRHDS